MANATLRDRAVRDRLQAITLRNVADRLSEAAASSGLASEEAEPSLARARRAADEAERRAGSGQRLSSEEWRLIGLAMALAQERQLYAKLHAEGLASASEQSAAQERVEAVGRAARAASPARLDQAALEAQTAFSKDFRSAVSMQRRFGAAKPLARAVARRFAVLALIRLVLRDQRDASLARVLALLPEDSRGAFDDLMARRLDAVQESLSALRMQYPDYAAALDRQSLDRASQRIALATYDDFLNQGLVRPSVHRELAQELRARAADAVALPPLTLKQDPRALISKVPFFAALDSKLQTQIAKRLRTRFTVANQRIVRRGETGREMYFIADGVARVLVEGEVVRLSTGDFFGELALINDAPRNADVVAVGFATLLVLRKPDFLRLLARHPGLRDQVRDVAIDRLGGGQVDI